MNVKEEFSNLMKKIDGKLRQLALKGNKFSFHLNTFRLDEEYEVNALIKINNALEEIFTKKAKDIILAYSHVMIDVGTYIECISFNERQYCLSLLENNG